MKNERVRRTETLINRAYSGEELDSMLAEITSVRKLSTIILPKMREMSIEALGDQIGCSRAHAYNITSGKMHPEKDMLIKIAFVLEMNVDEAQEMLKSSHRAALTATDLRDVCIIYGLANHISLNDMDSILIARGHKPLIPEKKSEKRIQDILEPYMNDPQITWKELAEMTECEEQLMDQYLCEEEMPPRDLLLRMALVLRVSLTDTQSMLSIEEESLLSVKDDRDMYIMNALANRKRNTKKSAKEDAKIITLEELNNRLLKHNLDPIWSALPKAIMLH